MHSSTRCHVRDRRRCHVRLPAASCRRWKKPNKHINMRLDESGTDLLKMCQKNCGKCYKMGLKRTRCHRAGSSSSACILLLRTWFRTQIASSSFSVSVCYAQSQLRLDSTSLFVSSRNRNRLWLFSLLVDPASFWTPLSTTAVCGPFSSKLHTRPVLILRKTTIPHIDLSWSAAHGGYRLCFLYLILSVDLYALFLSNLVHTKGLIPLVGKN